MRCENYGEFPIRVSVLRSESELQQQGDDRQGGLLVVDDQDVAWICPSSNSIANP